MMKQILYGAIVYLLAGCKQAVTPPPAWLNLADTIYMPDAVLRFKTIPGKWKACLQTSFQPIELRVQGDSGLLSIDMPYRFGIIEGPAQICLWQQNNFFYYPVYAINQQAPEIRFREYRSPKTVNPDSSLHQQLIFLQMDAHRNLLPLKAKTFFIEKQVGLAPKAGIYRAFKDEPLSSYYILPGSCKAITIQAVYQPQENNLYAYTSLLKDVYNNIVADGTPVTFTYYDGGNTWHMECAVQQGIARAWIPAEKNKKYQLKARINETFSNQLNITIQ
ncbi:MAG: hypothetical protein RL172_2889 [Bacteroidota bacterium]